MPERSVGYVLTLTRSPVDAGWVNAALRKQFWQVGLGTRSRAIVETGIWTQGLSEGEIVESALRELLALYCDRAG